MANFDLVNLALKSVCPNNLAKIDDTGLPSILVYIPKFKNSDVLTGGDNNTHPAFIVNGVEIPGFYYSKYQNVAHSGVAYSLPGEEPAYNITFDNAAAYCEAKGAGWHLSTAAEWAAIALWCKKNNFLPNGNNWKGRDYNETIKEAIPASYSNIVKTGTGPLAWSHNNALDGVWDMNGNVAEIQGGLRIVWGEVQILPNNDAADPRNSQSTDSSCWKAINAADGTLVEPESKPTDTAAKTTGSTVKMGYMNISNGLQYVVNNFTFGGSLTRRFGEILCADEIGNAAKVLLRSLALLPDEGTTAEDYGNEIVSIANLSSLDVLCRGGHCGSTSASFSDHNGVFHFTNQKITKATWTNGFRAAYIPELAIGAEV